MIQIKNLVKEYKSGGGIVRAVDDISFSLANTGLVVILGKSGCGKTTLLNTLGALDSFDSGDIIYNGLSLKDMDEKTANAYRNSVVGFVFQDYNIIETMTVFDNIAMSYKLNETSYDINSIERSLELVGLGGLGYRKPNELSGGQRQRVAIARAIVKDPAIILADEPTGALDSKTSEELFMSLKRLSKDRLVIVVTHDSDIAKRYGDRIISMLDGKIVSDQDRMEHSSLQPIETLNNNVIKVRSGNQLSLEDINDKLDTTKTNYITVRTEKQIVALAYPEKIDAIYAQENEGDFEEHIITEEESVEKEEYQPKYHKFSSKTALSMAWHNIRARKKKTRRMIIMSIMSLILFGLAICFSTISANNIIINTIQKVGIPYSSIQPVQQWMSYNSVFSEDNIDSYKSRFSNVEFGSVHEVGANLLLGNSANEDYSYVSYKSNEFGNYYIPYIISMDNINDFGMESYATSTNPQPNDIIITDYLANIFIENGITIIDEEGETTVFYPLSAEELIDKKLVMSYNDNYLRIGSVVKSGYEKMINNTYYNQYCNSFYGCLFVENEYKAEVLNLITDCSSKRFYAVSSYDETGYTYNMVANISQYKPMDNFVWKSAQFDPNGTLASNQVVLSMAAFCSMVGIYYDYYQIENSFDDAIKAANKNNKLHLEINLGYGPFINIGVMDIEVVGITKEVDEFVYFASEQKSKIIDNYAETSKGLMFMNNSNNYAHIIRSMDNENEVVSIIGLESIYSMQDTFRIISIIILIIAIVISVFIMLIMFNTMNMNVESRIKELGILRASGASVLDLLKSFLYEILIISLLSTAIASVIDYFIILLTNKATGVMMENLTVFSFGIWIPIVLAFVCTMFLLIASANALSKIKRLKPIDIIKQAF